MKLAFFLRLVAFKVSLFKTGTAGLLGLSANVKGRTFQYVSFYNFFVGSKKTFRGVPPKYFALRAPLKVHLLLSIYCFHFFS